MKKSAAVLFLLVLWGSFFTLAGNDLSDLRGLSLTHAKIPIYNKGGRPQMMIFVNKAERHGRVLSGTETVLEFIRPSASVDDIGDAWKTRAYPLGAPFRQVFDFWLPRNKYSEAVVTTSKADIDPQSRKASGSAPIFFRSPLLDLNGMGFEADFERREIRVNSEIEIVLRTGSSDPRKLHSIRNKKYEFLSASGDALLIELEKRRILLIGSVEIKDRQAVITCDRLTIEMSGKAGTGTEKKRKKLAPQAELDGLSRLLADGNIVVRSTAGNSGRIYADHMVYDLKTALITLTSDSPGKVMTREELTANASKLFAADPADIEGYVVLDDRQTRSYGQSVVVQLKSSGKKGLSPGIMGGGMAMTGGKKSSSPLSTILYPRGFILMGKPRPGQKESFILQADQGEYLPGHSVINLKDNITARDGSTRLTCSKAVLKLKKVPGKSADAMGQELNSIHCRENVRLLHQEQGARSGTLLAEKADFFPAENKILFYENVRARHDKSALSCRQLELLLADKKARSSSPAGTSAAGAAAAAKSLRQVIAKGNVRMTDPHAVLNTGELTMFFRDLLPGEKSAPGMLQAGGSRLVRIDCGSGVKIISSGSTGTQKLFGNAQSKGVKTLTAMTSSSDLLTHKTTLAGRVHIFDELTSLKCDTMHLYGKKITATAAQKKKTAAAADIDADPYAMLDTENFAPSRIALTGDLELDKVECLKKVFISHKVQDGLLQAGGDRADYKVSSQKIVITGKEPNRPWVEMGNRRQESDRLVYHLAGERFESSGNTQTILKKQSPTKGVKK